MVEPRLFPFDQDERTSCLLPLEDREAQPEHEDPHAANGPVFELALPRLWGSYVEPRAEEDQRNPTRNGEDLEALRVEPTEPASIAGSANDVADPRMLEDSPILGIQFMKSIGSEAQGSNGDEQCGDEQRASGTHRHSIRLARAAETYVSVPRKKDLGAV